LNVQCYFAYFKEISIGSKQNLQHGKLFWGKMYGPLDIEGLYFVFEVA